MRRVITGDRKAFADISDAHVGRLYLCDGSWHASVDVRTKGISGSKGRQHRREWPADEGLSKLKAGRKYNADNLSSRESNLYLNSYVKLLMFANHVDAAVY